MTVQTEKFAATPRSAKQLRLVGLITLWVGLVAGVSIYLTAPTEERNPILGIDVRTNRDRMQLERMGGKAYVMFKDLDDWFASLWHGRQLGCTIGVLSILGYFICRGLAHVQDEHAKSGDQARQDQALRAKGKTKGES